ncbi:transposase [Sphingomonas zeicaulis]
MDWDDIEGSILGDDECHAPGIPGRKSLNEPIKFDKRRYRRRNRIEIMFGRLKDWRRVATRYDRCPTAFLWAIALAATVIFLALIGES